MGIFLLPIVPITVPSTTAWTRHAMDAEELKTSNPTMDATERPSQSTATRMNVNGIWSIYGISIYIYIVSMEYLWNMMMFND